jgi:transposase
MVAISNDLRERVVRLVEGEGTSRRQAAARLMISPASAIRILQRYDEAGVVAPKKRKSRLSPLAKYAEAISAMVDKRPDATLKELVATIRDNLGVATSKSAVDRFLKKIGLKFKKSLIADEQTRDDVALKRGWFRRVAQRYMDHVSFVFIDETGMNLGMTRARGRALVGERLVCSAPGRCRRSLTLVAALGVEGIVASMIFNGAVDGACFVAWVKKILVPALRPGTTVVMDNLSVHKDSAVEAALRAAGCSLLFTPPYSPDLNPIEMFFSKLKAALRAVEARTMPALDAAIADVIASLKPEECRNFFIECGYDSL